MCLCVSVCVFSNIFQKLESESQLRNAAKIAPEFAAVLAADSFYQGTFNVLRAYYLSIDILFLRLLT